MSSILQIRNIVKRILPSARYGSRMLSKVIAIDSKVDRIIEKQEELDRKNELLFWASQRMIGESSLETRKRMFLEMPQAMGRTREFQLILNALLQIIKQDCKESGIVFFLFGGTLLGAERHRGFIPWDDDIDIGIMAQDVTRLYRCIENDKRLSIGQYLDIYGHRFIKIKFVGIDAFYVDVFPFEYLEVENNKSSEIDQSIELYREYQSALKRIAHEFITEEMGDAPVRIPMEYERRVGEVAERCHSDMPYWGKGDKIARLFDYVLDEQSFRLILSAENVNPLIDDAVEFEGEKYFAFSNYKDFLEEYYGNIWTLPRDLSLSHSNQTVELVADRDFDQLRKIGIKWERQ